MVARSLNKTGVLTLIVCLIAGTSSIVAQTGEPRGLRLKCEGASPGYTLFAPMSSDTTYLIDLEGRAVRTWKSAYLPSAWVYFMDNGHVLRGGSDKGASPFGGGGQGGRFQEFDLEGNLVWDFQYNQPRLPHHDVAILPNGNILAIAWEGKTAEESRRVGRRASAVPPGGIWPDMLMEFEPQRPSGARIVWEWHIWDHLIQNIDPALENYAEPAAHPERININADTGGAAFSRDVFHTNAVGYNPALDQIILSIPTFNEIWVIDHSTTAQEAAGRTGGRSGKGGDLLYRWGNPQAYGRGTAADQLLGFQHDATWIPQGLPGAGHIMVFSNRTPTPYGATTKVYEFVPPVDGDGHYTISSTGPFEPTAPAWSYSDDELQTINLSGAQRLANGNTLISSGPQGRLFEVTSVANVVWEYWSPYSGSSIAAGAFSLFRALKIPPDHPGLKGHDLSPLNPQPAISSFASIGTGSVGNCPTAAPTLTDLHPSTLGQGTTIEVTLTGDNFVPGMTVLGDSNITVNDVKVANSTTATATLTIGSTAPTGSSTIRVATPGGTSGSVPLNIVEPFPDLSVVSSHVGNFGVGFEEKYVVTVRNGGAVPTTGTILVKDELPPGLAFTSGGGTGWTCSAAGQDVTCADPEILNANDSTSYTITVAVNRTAAARSTHALNLLADGDLNTADNSATEFINVVKPSPVLAFTPYPVIPGEQATVGVTMQTPFPHDVAGTLTLTFESNAFIPADDPAIQFATGGRTATFRILANETGARFGGEFLQSQLAFQAGTVAGSLRFAGSLTAGTVQEEFSADSFSGLTIPLRALGIQTIQTSVQDGFAVSMLMFSAAREVTQLILVFNTTPKVLLSCGAAPGCSAAGNTLTLDVAPAFAQWFKTDSIFGGLAQIRLPLRIEGGAVKGTVAVTFKNTQGESNSQSFALP